MTFPIKITLKVVMFFNHNFSLTCQIAVILDALPCLGMIVFLKILIFLNNFFIFLNYFNVLMLKIIFKI